MRNRDRSSCATGHLPQGGLTKREAAAIAAMQGYMAADIKDSLTCAEIAHVAVEAADALFDKLDEGERTDD